MDKSTALLVVEVIFMIIITLLIGYFINSTISLKKYITNNLHKFYMNLFMALQMGIIMTIMSKDLTLFIFSIILLILIIFVGYKLYSLDFLSDDKQFMKAMIEHHSLALSMADKIYMKTKNPELKKIAEDILISQEQQINDFYRILSQE